MPTSPQPAYPPTPRYLRPAFFIPAVGILALLVRILYLLQLRHAPTFGILIGDAEVYDPWARQIAAGDWFGKAPFYQAPMYPYFLAAWYWIAGPGFWKLLLAQSVIGALSCSLLAAAGRRLFSPTVGLIAGVMLALYPSAIYFDGLIQKTVLDNFFLTLLLFLIACLADRPSRPLLWVSAGVSLACLALTRENSLILPPLVIAWLFFYFRDSAPRRRTLWAALILLGMATLLFPVAWRNHRLGSGFALTTSQFGTNLFIGNHPGATGLYIPLIPGHGHAPLEQKDAVELAQRETGRTLNPSQVSSFWTAKTLDYIREHPADWLSLMAKKLWLTWNAYEVSDTDDQYFITRYSWLLALLTACFHFGVICVPAALGIVLWPDRRRAALLYLFLIFYSLSVALFYIFARYRYPLVPVLLLFAAAGVVQTIKTFRAREYSRLAAALAIAAAVTLTVNWPTGFRVRGDANMLYNMSVTELEQNKPDQAADYARQAIQLNPNHWGAHDVLGNIHYAQGDYASAADQFRAALQIAPNSSELHSSLGYALGARRQLPEAEREFQTAITLDPNNPLPYNGLGVVYAKQGKTAQALDQFHKAITLNPDYEEAKLNYQAMQNQHP